MGLVHDQEVVRPRGRRLIAWRERFPEQARRSLTFQEIDRRDQPWKMRPRIDVNPASTTQVREQSTVDNPELKTELVAHLLLPLNLNRGRTDDQNAPRPVTKNQFLGDKTCLDRLSQTYV